MFRKLLRLAGSSRFVDRHLLGTAARRLRVEPLEERRLLSATAGAGSLPYMLDPTFGNLGKAVFAVADGDAGAAAVALQADGKIVVAGTAKVQDEVVFALARLNPDGSRDDSFGTNGVAITPMGFVDTANVEDVEIAPDGRIVVAGYAAHSSTDSDYELALACYNSDGSLDTTFADQGKLIAQIEGNSTNLRDMLIQPDGRIVVIGQSNRSGSWDTLLLRYTSGGQLDSTWNGTGVAVEPALRIVPMVSLYHTSYSQLVMQSDERIVAGGTIASGSVAGFSMVRYNTDGTKDTAFDPVPAPNYSFFTFRGLAIQPDDKFLLLGEWGDRSYSGSVVGRFNGDGTADATFGASGILDLPHLFSYASSVQSDGTIVVARGMGVELFRYINTSGFTSVLTTTFGGASDLPLAVAVQPDGGVVVTGQSDGRFALLRAKVAPVSAACSVGVVDPDVGQFYLCSQPASGYADNVFGFGPGGDAIALVGDWNADGTDTAGVYMPDASVFYLRNSNSTGMAETAFGFGAPGAGWLPIEGDWDGDGMASVGLYDPQSSLFYLRNANSPGMSDITVAFGVPNAGWLPIAGDWNGDGVDTIGLYDPHLSLFYLRNSNTPGFGDVAFAFGAGEAGWLPIAGDWDNDGKESPGLYDPTGSLFYLRNAYSDGIADLAFGFGAPGQGWRPVAGAIGPTPTTLLAAEGPIVSSGMAMLDDAAAQTALQAALARWAEQGMSLGAVDVVIADLPGAMLGQAQGDVIYLDTNAAGHGWFVDPTPGVDEEFTSLAASSTLRAVDTAAVDRIDLLTVVEHELGHVAGLRDLDVTLDTLMSATLPAGARRLASVT